jgi:xanthine dehydrogenase/oxidase
MFLPEGVPGGMEQYRQTLTLSFFFKFYMSLLQAANENHDQLHLTKIDADDFCATQVFRVEFQSWKFDKIHFQNDATGPIGRPIAHQSGEKHTTGKAVYTDDIETTVDTLHMQFVLATKANAEIVSVDSAEALKVPGVVAVFTYDDLVSKV